MIQQSKLQKPEQIFEQEEHYNWRKEDKMHPLQDLQILVSSFITSGQYD